MERKFSHFYYLPHIQFPALEICIFSSLKENTWEKYLNFSMDF